MQQLSDLLKNSDLVTASTISPDGNFYYTTELANNEFTVNTLARNANTGTLSRVQSLNGMQIVPEIDTPLFSPNDLAISPDGNNLYVAGDFGSNNVENFPFRNSVLVFNIASDGTLVYVSRVIVDADEAIVLVSTGDFLISGDARGLNLLSRAPNGSLEVLSYIETDKNGNSLIDPGALAISPDDQSVYASSFLGGGHLYTFSLDRANASLNNTQVFSGPGHQLSAVEGVTEILGQGGRSSVVTQDGRFYYSVGGTRNNEAEGTISIFERNASGNLQFLSNVLSPVSEQNSLRILFSADQFVSITPDQKFLLVADRIKENIGVWRRDFSTGDLTYMGVLYHGDAPINADSATSTVLAPDGRHLYVGSDSVIAIYDLRADMVVVKTDSQDPIGISGSLTYTLAVTNNGPSDAQNVVVTDTLPTGVTFSSGTVNSPSGSCNAEGQTVTCTMGRLFSESGYNALVNVIAPSTPGEITNSARVSSDQLDTLESNSSDTETTVVGNVSIDTGDTGSTNTDSSMNTDNSITNDSGGGVLDLLLLSLLVSGAQVRRQKAFIKIDRL